MPVSHLPLDTLVAWIRGLPPDDRSTGSHPGHVVVVDLDAGDASDVPALHPGLPVIVVGTTAVPAPETHAAAPACDVVVAPDDPALDQVLAQVGAHPIAATALALLLRGAETRTVAEGLLAESAVYSALQGGPEFAAWRASRPPRTRAAEGEPVHLTRTGAALHIELCRPHVRNALDTAMRDALVEAFTLPAVDAGITEVHLTGAGPDFCAGGDLDEFGSFADPASAHLVRLQQSVGRRIDAVADRVTAHLHGACFGSGIELPAFAARVVADPSARIALPEVGLGLVPGAGGTVSIPRRIGRHRTARLALTGEVLDAPTAAAWGLVDRISPRSA